MTHSTHCDSTDFPLSSDHSKVYFNPSLLHPLSAELPGPPTNLAISNIGPRSVTLQFKPGYDGKTSISRWLVEAQVRHFTSVST